MESEVQNSSHNLRFRGKVPVLVNRKAGSSDQDGKLERLFEQAGVGAEIFNLDPEHMLGALIEVQRRGPEAVFVAGGDGTARLAASLLYKNDVALGVLPLGTLNHFSGDLGIPETVEEAVPALLTGRTEYIDIGSVNGHIFVNNTNIGIYPEAVRKRSLIQKRLGIGKYLAMTLALTSSFRRLPYYDLTLVENGLSGLIRTPFLFVGNNLYNPDLFAPVRRESLKDGRFSLFYARRTTRVELLGLALRTLLGLLRGAPKMEMKSVEGNILIKSGKRRIEVALDGEVLRMSTPLEFRLLPRTLKVILPG